MSSLGSEALQIKINTNVKATIGDTNVELWCSYIKDDVDLDYIYLEIKQVRNTFILLHFITQNVTVMLYWRENILLVVCSLQTLRMNQIKLF